MKSLTFPLLLGMLALFSSCNNDYSGRSGVRQQLAIPRENMRYDSTLFKPAYGSNGTLNQNHFLSQPLSQPNPLAAQALAQTPNNSGQPFDTAATLLAQGLNPPHGYPGHRCDLKVGEALTSKPETKATTQGLNPPHGQPGHRCDIAVGAPLNSKPATATAQPPAAQTIVSPDAMMALKNGLNPAHGQPGHRCDIAVGARLDSKPLTETNPVQTSTPVSENSTGTSAVDDSTKS